MEQTALDFGTEIDEFIDWLPNEFDTPTFWFFHPSDYLEYITFRNGGFISIGHEEIDIQDLYSQDALQDVLPLINHNRNSNFDDQYSIVIESSLLNKDKVAVLVNKFNKSKNVFNTKHTVTDRIETLYNFYSSMRPGDFIIMAIFDESYVKYSIGTLISETSEITKPKVVKLESIKKRYDLIKKVQFLEDLKNNMTVLGLHLLEHNLLLNITLQKAYSLAPELAASIGNFFILHHYAYLVINVGEINYKIDSKEFFEFGSILMKWIDGFAQFTGIDIHSSQLEMQISIYSPGRITIKSKFKRTTIIAGLILLLAGGGYEDKAGNSLKTRGVPGIIDAITEFLDRQQERNMKQQLFTQYKDSLKVKDPEDLVRLWKQFSENKDQSK